MNGKILVAYASKYGATREIAEKIGKVLLGAGLQADVYPVNDIHDLSPYKTVILGSAIYVGNWQKEAVRFLEIHQKDLARRQVWLFSSGPTGEGDPLGLVEGKLLPNGLQPVIDRIQPRDVTIFHGNIDPNKVNPIEKWAVKSLVKKPFGDYRDWDSIVAWSTRIASALQEGDPVLMGGVSYASHVR